jgi:hypothetical protein
MAADEKAVQFLGQRLRPASAPPAEEIEDLIKDLDNKTYRVREEASRKLQALGDLIQPALAKSLRGDLNLEARKRIEHILDRLESRDLVAEQVRPLRAVAVLEYTGSPAAQSVLEQLAGGAPGALLTREAADALERLKH